MIDWKLMIENNDNEIGDVTIKDGTYQFMTVADEIDTAEVILEIISSDLNKAT